MQLETVAMTEAFDKIANASASLGKKIFDKRPGRGPSEVRPEHPAGKGKASLKSDQEL